MPRKSIANGGQPNRPKEVINAIKMDQQARREWRTATEGVKSRGRLKAGVVYPGTGIAVAEAQEVAE